MIFLLPGIALWAFAKPGPWKTFGKWLTIVAVALYAIDLVFLAGVLASGQ